MGSSGQFLGYSYPGDAMKCEFVISMGLNLAFRLWRYGRIAKQKADLSV